MSQLDYKKDNDIIEDILDREGKYFYNNYAVALGNFDSWLKQEENRDHFQKIQLFNLIQIAQSKIAEVEKKAEAGQEPQNNEEDEAFQKTHPSIEEINNYLDPEKIKQYRPIDEIDQIETLSKEEAAEIGNRLTGHKKHLFLIEFHGSQLTKYLVSNDFLDAIDSLPIHKLFNYHERYFERLEECRAGRKLIFESLNTIQTHQENRRISFLDPLRIGEISEWVMKNGSKIRKFTGLTRKISDFFIKINIYATAKAILPNAAHALQKSSLQVINALYQHTFENSMVMLSNFIQSGDIDGTTPGLNPIKRLTFVLSEDIKEIENNNPNLKRAKPSPENLDEFTAFHRLRLFASVLGLTSSINTLKEDLTDLENHKNFTKHLLETIEDINSIPGQKFMRLSSAQAVALKRALAVVNVASIYYDLEKGVEAFKEGDHSLVTGYTLSVTSTLVGFGAQLATGAGLFGIGLAATWWTGVGLVIFLIAAALIVYTKDTPTDKWFRENYFGKDYHDHYFPHLHPDDFAFRFDEIERQIIKYFSLLIPPKIKNVELHDGIHIDDTMRKAWLKKSGIDIDQADISGKLRTLKFEVTNPAIYEFSFDLGFWSREERRFFHETKANFRVSGAPETWDSIPWGQGGTWMKSSWEDKHEDPVLSVDFGNGKDSKVFPLCYESHFDLSTTLITTDHQELIGTTDRKKIVIYIMVDHNLVEPYFGRLFNDKDIDIEFRLKLGKGNSQVTVIEGREVDME